MSRRPRQRRRRTQQLRLSSKRRRRRRERKKESQDEIRRGEGIEEKKEEERRRRRERERNEVCEPRVSEILTPVCGPPLAPAFALSIFRDLFPHAPLLTRKVNLSLSLFLSSKFGPPKHTFFHLENFVVQEEKRERSSMKMLIREKYFEVYLILLSDYLHASVATP